MARAALPLAVVSAGTFTALAFVVGVSQATYLPVAVVVGWLTAGLAGARREHPVGGLALGSAPFTPLTISLFTLAPRYGVLVVGGGVMLGGLGYAIGRRIPRRTA
ncbi:hypothetical protein [Natronomonas sp. EA1]|uniref:hypothetical protein n=1 Tax=Natronomonas sp. EA1 TaxID=3421655 RepID=UPI003EBAE484